MSTRTSPTLTLLVLAALASASCADGPGAAVVSPDEAALMAGSADPAPVAVLSRNLYLGADIDRVLSDPVNGGALAWAEITRTNYPERAAALAAEIVGRAPHLVGLQEVSRFVVLDPATFTELAVIDFLDILNLHLQAAGAPYQVVTRAVNFQAILPVGDLLVQYTDGDAILASADGVTVENAGSRHFALENQVDLGAVVPGLGYNLRGFQWADVRVDGQAFRFVNTHLEIQRWADIQERQTAELLAFLESGDGPIVMVGDFNSAANPDAPAASRTGSYAAIRATGFADLWLRDGGAPDGGLTCCQRSDLSNDEPQLTQRIDFIFARNVPSDDGYAGRESLHLVGDNAADRFPTSAGYDLWPSDHAGLFGELRMPPGLVAN